MRRLRDLLRDPVQQVRRRSYPAFLMQLNSPRWVNAAWLRAGFVVTYAATVVGQTLTHPSLDATVAWLGAAVAGIGTFLSWRLAHASVDPGTVPGLARWNATVAHLQQSRAMRDPVARYVLIDFRRTAKAAVNLSGILEFVGVGLMGAGLNAFEDPRFGLVACACAIAYIWSACLNMCVYQAWYVPHERTSPALEWVRVLIGPIGAVVCAVIAVPAFDGTWRWAAAALCVSMLALGPRIRQTDQVMAAMGELADDEFLRGRMSITKALHDEATQTLEQLQNELAERPDIDRFVYDKVRSAHAELREILALDWDARYTLEWPKVLRAKASRLSSEGFRLTMDLPDGPAISRTDRAVARLVLEEFTRNAVKSGAGKGHSRLSRDGLTWVLSVVDDGAPIDPDAVTASQNGIYRLERLIRGFGGAIACEPPKTMRATWYATEADDDGDIEEPRDD